MNKIGNIAFLLALVMAVISTIGVEALNNFMWIIALMGAVFAIFSLKDDNAMVPVVLAVGLSMMAGGLSGIPAVGGYISVFAGHMAAFMGAAALIVALRWLWNEGDVMGLFSK
ncbi:hypothetical protein [Biformimicrobium ophioploci]|uniref:Uncharacterized protein n=1 Tax=Biformimicrobium ophioploci TaxID=3036711 RepID=A0ABQ6LYC1_9GAMM|nr:hypothetical protein [Microbulbifer sp. NKW57]GMG87101.1 hypothetical protein MNKW57_14220 [Microbulbifer sp. NKW57]